MGQSLLQASTVSLILNLQTGNISPQYLVVHDDFLETVYSDSSEPPAKWAKLVTLSCSSCAFDNEEEYVPELNDEWLTPEEPQSR